MAIAMKGIFRGLKIIAQIFTVQREHEIEIGYPTDVRHVSHIGLDASDSCPSWMSEFRGVEEVTAGARGASIVGSAAQSTHTSWASLDLEQAATGAAPLPTEASASGQDGSGCGGSGSGSGSGGRGPVPAKTTKKEARPRRGSGRAASPGGSSSWRSTASSLALATVCDGHSCELHVPPAGLQAA